MAQLRKSLVFVLFGVLFSSAAAQSGCTFIFPSPSGSTCAGIGSISNPSPLCEVQYVSDPEVDCADLCTRRANPPGNREITGDEGCVSFSYYQQTGYCQLYTKTAAEMGFVSNPTEGGEHFQDVDCFSCPAQCPQKLGRDLLDNGDFEQSKFYIGPWLTSTHLFSFAKGYKSRTAYACNNISNCELGQKFQQCTNQLYRASWMYKIASSGSPDVAIVANNVKLNGDTSKQTWQSEEVWFRGDSNNVGPMDFSVSGNGHKIGSFDLDNVHVSPVSNTFKAKPNAKNMVLNGGFESGKLAPWKAHIEHGHGVVVKKGISGKYSFQYNGTVGTGNPKGHLTQSFKVKPGTRYVFSYKQSRQGANAQFGGAVIAGRSYTGLYLKQQQKQFTFEIPFTPQESPVDVTFLLGSGPFLTDDVSVKEMAK